MPATQSRQCVRSLARQLGLILFALVAVAPVAAADSPLSQVPADASIVVYAHGFERTKDRLLTTIQKSLPDLAPKVRDGIDVAIKGALAGREVKGLPKDGSVFVAIFNFGQPSIRESDEVAMIIQVTSYANFRDSALKETERQALKKDPAGYEQTQINSQDMYFAERDGYAVVTPSKKLAQRLAKREAGLDTVLHKALATKLLEADAGVYVNMAALNKTFAAQIQEFRQEFNKALALGANGGGAGKNAAAMAKRIGEPFFQAIEDSQALVATCEFRPEGFNLCLDVSVGTDTKTSTLLKDCTLDSFAGLAKLPTGALGYTGVAVDARLFKNLMPLMLGIVDDPGSPEGKAYAQGLEALTAAKPRGMIQAFRMPARGLTIWDYEYPDKAAAAHLQLMQSVKAGSSYMANFIKGEPKVVADAQSYRGYKFSSASFTWDLDKVVSQGAAKELPEQMKERMKAAMKQMVGERMTYWFGSDGKAFVMVMDDRWEDARKMFDAYLDGKSSVGDDKAFQDARSQLPAKATVVGLIDAPQYARFMINYMQAFLLPGDAPPKAPILKTPSRASFAGMAATFEEQRGSFQLWIPVAAVTQVREMVEPLFQQLKGQ